jgi:hypothetical protein
MTAARIAEASGLLKSGRRGWRITPGVTGMRPLRNTADHLRLHNAHISTIFLER